MTAATQDAPKVKETKRSNHGVFLTGWCSSDLLTAGDGERAWHGGCRGSVVNGNGSILVCGCGCHANHTVCRVCGRVDVEIATEGPTWGACLDVEDCGGFLAERRANNPLRKHLDAVRSPADDGPTEVMGARRRPRKASDGTQAPGSPPRPVKAPREPQKCHCGCGGMTKGGSFVAGHDMKLKSALYALARSSHKKAPRPEWVSAAAEIVARGWKQTGIPDPTLTKAVERVAKTSPEAVIATSVLERYEGGSS